MVSLSLLTDEKSWQQSAVSRQGPSAVVFAKPGMTEAERCIVTPSLANADFIAVVSSFRVHLGDQSAVRGEAQAMARVKDSAARVVVFRAGHILGANSTTSAWLRRFGFAYPLVPRRLRNCFVAQTDLFKAIDAVRNEPSARRVITVLGPNRPWKDVLRDHRPRGVLSSSLTGICYLLSLLLVGHLAALLLELLALWRPSLRAWNFDTLRPKSFDELLALYNPHNYQHVKVVGYNNGVVHFGHRYPGKTVVSTVQCNRITRTSSDVIKADCGATIRQAMDFLAAADQELYVLPNYSYVCLGTAFFVPIHGSAADYTTVAETIVKALLYDPVSDRFILARSDEPAFRGEVYNFASNMIVLRLWMRVQAKARYFVNRQELENASSEQVLSALRDGEAANVEIRKSQASSGKIHVSKYYKVENATPSTTLEVPRDSLGRLWDRLEENAVTSFLMHALTRWLAWHIELFFPADEFAIFWQTHQALPLKKIQLRFIRRDGLPQSPFREHDCVSVDLFMFRWSRRQVETYLKQTFAVVRSNPGKHSR